MKRPIIIALLVLFSFVLGWVCACVRVQSQASERLALLNDEHARSIASIRNEIYGSNYFHSKGISPEDDARLERFDPAADMGFIVLSYVGGLGGADTHLKIEGDGGVSVTEHGSTRKVLTLDRERCAGFFMRVMTSGILNYSDAVIALKMNLARPRSTRMRYDAPSSGFHIRVPALDVDKRFSLDTQVEPHNFPDIIEFQLAAELEKEILSFIPKEDPFWK